MAKSESLSRSFRLVFAARTASALCFSAIKSSPRPCRRHHCLLSGRLDFQLNSSTAPVVVSSAPWISRKMAAFTRTGSWAAQIKQAPGVTGDGDLLVADSPMSSSTSIDRKVADSSSSKWTVEEPHRPRPIVVCGPSGSGKSTLLKRLMEEFSDYFGFSVSHTTRTPRGGEMNGKDYHFYEREEMIEAIKNGEFIEYTEFSGNIYGTSKRAVKEVLDKDRICILDVEIEGVKNLKKTDLNPRFIFIKPPSMTALEERLRKRGTESESAVNKRLARARDEMVYGEVAGNFDTVLVNDEIDEAYAGLRDFILHDIEELKKSRGM